MDYCSVIKRIKFLIHTTTGIDLKIIMLSERSQTRKNTCCMILVYT